MSWYRDDPILVLGMHRSGTTLLARQLDALGVFMGHRLEQNHEAVACLDLNDRILARAHAAWDRPAGIADLLAHGPAVDAVVGSMREELDSLGFRRSYLGIKRGATGGLGRGPWGFKDPRTTVTWPLWQRLLPGARAVYVRRHGVDVAASLWRRATKELAPGSAARFAGDDHLARFASVRCLDLGRAFELWRETHALHVRHCEANPSMPMHEILYEDLLRDPVPVLTSLVRFLELEVPPEAIASVAEGIDASRALAHRRDPELADFADAVAADPDLAAWNETSP